MANLIEILTGVKKDKAAYRTLQRRVDALPEEYRYVFKKMQAYMLNYAGGDGMDIVALCDGLADMFEEGIADGKRISEIIGDDAAAFCDELICNANTWQDRWRTSLNESIRKKLEDDKNR